MNKKRIVNSLNSNLSFKYVENFQRIYLCKSDLN